MKTKVLAILLSALFINAAWAAPADSSDVSEESSEEVDQHHPSNPAVVKKGQEVAPVSQKIVPESVALSGSEAVVKESDEVRAERQYYGGYPGGYNNYGSGSANAFASAQASANANGFRYKRQYYGGYPGYGGGSGSAHASAQASASANSGGFNNGWYGK